MFGELILPPVHLSVDGDTFYAEGNDPVKWSIYAEADELASARTHIAVADKVVSNVTIHAPSRTLLLNEVQEVAAGLLWSAIRGWYYNQEKVVDTQTHRSIEVEAADGRGVLRDINFELGRVYNCSNLQYMICFDDTHFVLIRSEGRTGTGDRIYRRSRLPRDEKRVQLLNMYHYAHQHGRGNGNDDTQV